MNTSPAPVGAAATLKGFLMTEKKAHQAWAQLIDKDKTAAALLHTLVAYMDKRNAVVVSQKNLAALMGKTLATISRAVRVLREDGWIQVVRINGQGAVNAYVVNSAVAWSDRRENKQYSTFHATVIAAKHDQAPYFIETPTLRKIPALFAGEAQLPTGEQNEYGQQVLPGFLPDLPALSQEGESET